MTISQANRLFFRVLAALAFIGGIVILYLSVCGPKDFPQRDELVRSSGTVTWTQPDRYSIKFRFADDARTFSYAQKSGELHAVASTLKRRASQPITVLVLPQHQGWASEPFYQVYELEDAQGAVRTLAQVGEAWSSDYKFGYVAAFMAFLAAGFLELIVRKSSPSSLQRRADELQAYLTSCVSDLRRVLGEQGKDSETVRREAYGILARMESRNSEGRLDAFIQDNRESVDLELKRRNAA